MIDSSSYRHLFNVSGSGKTRLLLEGLCHHWGFYFACRVLGPSAGSKDFESACKTMESMTDWENDLDHPGALGRSGSVANWTFVMLQCSRFYVLTEFMKHIPDGTSPKVA